MPKKPFTPEEVAAQRERIMSAASQVMADVGFHHLSMRKLASQLGMTASNIYNYFPDKEYLFLHTRLHGFGLLLTDINEQMRLNTDPRAALMNFAQCMIQFAQQSPGYYQLMFQPPRLRLDETDHQHRDVQQQAERMLEEWQTHLMSLLSDAFPEELKDTSDTSHRQLALFFVSSVHGLIDTYHHGALSGLLSGIELIPEDVINTQLEWLMASLVREAEAAA